MDVYLASAQIIELILFISDNWQLVISQWLVSSSIPVPKMETLQMAPESRMEIFSKLALMILISFSNQSSST